MGRFQETVAIPSEVSIQRATNVIEKILEENDQFEIESTKEEGDQITISAKAKPNLLSWGEEIWIQIRPTEVEVVSENTSQIIDWNRPQKNVHMIVTNFKEEFNHRENPV